MWVDVGSVCPGWWRLGRGDRCRGSCIGRWIAVQVGERVGGWRTKCESVRVGKVGSQVSKRQSMQRVFRLGRGAPGRTVAAACKFTPVGSEHSNNNNLQAIDFKLQN